MILKSNRLNLVEEDMLEFILAQVLGGIALILICTGYFMKKKAHLLVIHTIANFFYASAFIFVGGYVAWALTMVSVIRCIYLYIAEKKNFKYTMHFLPIFMALYMVLTIIFWKTPYDFMPLITSTLFTIGFAIKDLQTMRYIFIIPNVILVVYNILTTTYASALLDFIEAIVIVVAIIKYSRSSKSSKNDENIKRGINYAK